MAEHLDAVTEETVAAEMRAYQEFLDQSENEE